MCPCIQGDVRFFMDPAAVRIGAKGIAGKKLLIEFCGTKSGIPQKGFRID